MLQLPGDPFSSPRVSTSLRRLFSYLWDLSSSVRHGLRYVEPRSWGQTVEHTSLTGIADYGNRCFLLGRKQAATCHSVRPVPLIQPDCRKLTSFSVGNIGDSGVIEISDMMWTVKGGTAGAILMQWNVHESTKGSGKSMFFLFNAPTFSS